MAPKASKFATEDVINSMPDGVVTHILDRLPIQDAVRTCILSKKWRFRWTMLSQLVFDHKFLMYLIKTNGASKCYRIISRLLLNVKGAIKKFVLHIEELNDLVLDDEDIRHWILFLSSKGVKDLTIWKMCYGQLAPLNLPTHLFSCIELEHLKLVHCCFNPPASFHGFPNLLSLELRLVQYESSKFGDFITRCPSLEILSMGYQPVLLETKKLDLISLENAKFANLKILSLSLCHLDDMMITNSNSIFHILPNLQKLELEFELCKVSERDAKKRFFTTFPSLKALKLTRISLGDGIMVSYALELIRIFPNLQTLEIIGHYSADGPTPAVCSPDVDYNTMGLLQLQRVVFTYIKASENELCLIKYLLACSPLLKKIVIHPHFDLFSDERLMLAKKLLKLHRASPVVDIDLC